ncbi:MAG: rhodanese-like domain-containing protein [Cardiobacteriaceae bacterium]|nr:rhodanese-like domain-containing protein [Cardiobacteriaceae bacterium]
MMTPLRKTLLLALLPASALADVLIDVRTPGEYNAGHLDNAILLPVQEIGDNIAAVAPDHDETIYLYCRSGARADAARDILREQGYRQVINLGSMGAARDWLQAHPEVTLRAVE